MSMNTLDINEDNIYSIDSFFILKNQEEETKRIIKEMRNKIKMANPELKSVIQRYKPQIIAEKKKEQNLKRHRSIICPKCDRLFKTKSDLDKHKKSRYPCHKNSFNRLKCIENNFEVEKKNIQIRIEQYKSTIKRYEPILRRIKIRLDEITLKCQKCRNPCIKSINILCSYNHLICIDCSKDSKYNERCPVCKEIKEKEECPICMTNEYPMVETECGNGHNICTYCIQQIYNTSNKCPFCRSSI